VRGGASRAGRGCATSHWPAGSSGSATAPSRPWEGKKRHSALELQIKALIGNDLRVEEDLSRWFPVWGAPGL
jgi:hypothetical protein